MVMIKVRKSPWASPALRKVADCGGLLSSNRKNQLAEYIPMS